MTRDVRMLCVADEIDLLVYSNQICERFSDIDLILSAGDLPNEYLEYIVSMLNRPIVSVAGNHDKSDLPQDRGALHYIADQRGSLGQIRFSIKKECGVRILGLPGCIRYNNGQNQYSDTWMTFRLISMIPRLFVRRFVFGRSVDVILAHSPPRGIHDGGDPAHIGFSAYRWLIKLAKPYYFIHGHVHLYDIQELREMEYCGTKVVNVYGHRVLTLPKEARDVR